jgi:hypothetical protein
MANGVTAAPLDENSRDEMLYWYREGNDLPETFKALAASHMIEAVHYGPDFYRKRAIQLVRELAKVGITMPSLSKPYNTWIAEWYHEGDLIQTTRTNDVLYTDESSMLMLQGLCCDEDSVGDLTDIYSLESDEITHDGSETRRKWRFTWFQYDLLYTGYLYYAAGHYPRFLHNFDALTIIPLQSTWKRIEDDVADLLDEFDQHLEQIPEDWSVQMMMDHLYDLIGFEGPRKPDYPDRSYIPSSCRGLFW